MFEYKGIKPRIVFDDWGDYQIIMDEYDIYVEMSSLEVALAYFREQVDDYFDKKGRTH